MSLFSVGRVCFKIAGRDAGRRCVVVEAIDDHFVLVDGDVRRKKVNVKHLEPLADVLELKENAPHSAVKTAFEKAGFAVWETKPKQVGEKPVRRKKVKAGAQAGSSSKAVSSEKKAKEAKAAVKETATSESKKEVAPRKKAAKKE